MPSPRYAALRPSSSPRFPSSPRFGSRHKGAVRGRGGMRAWMILLPGMLLLTLALLCALASHDGLRLNHGGLFAFSRARNVTQDEGSPADVLTRLKKGGGDMARESSRETVAAQRLDVKGNGSSRAVSPTEKQQGEEGSTRQGKCVTVEQMGEATVGDISAADAAFRKKVQTFALNYGESGMG